MQLSAKDLSQALGVAPATLSLATKRRHRCMGYPVREWARYGPNNKRVIGYEVPAAVLAKLRAGRSVARPNPSSKNASKPTELRPEGIPPSVSVLPPQQSYVEPIAAGGTAYVLTEAVRHDNHSGRAVIILAAAGVGAIIGEKCAGQKGALVGGVGLAVLAVYSLNTDNSAQQQPVCVNTFETLFFSN